ncbi:signal peptidase I [Pontibacillus yanchengensis]|uniref:Signal peptidase I n=1 Tax=Pontibacillus yanchengensis Y32 TaxID=1385514 RepID=A0A0A2TDR9_9BACI|nr:signal peptidase I [Pontibacillus yanchengensis]KGP73972.1 signal peptidase I [Pontibacillus yanchengensis Y32]
MTGKRSEWFDWVKALGIAAAIAIIIRVFLFSPVIVDGPSMLPTLHDGDYLIVNKISYTIGDPERFDVVVFHATETRNYIKRVIGLPGEHIEYKNETLLVNGKPVSEPFIKNRLQQLNDNQTYTFNFSLEDLPGGYQKIPEGYVLVLGDNRNNSTDSRRLGLIPIERIVGEAQFKIWPPSRIGTVN